MRAAALARPEAACLHRHCGTPPLLRKRVCMAESPVLPASFLPCAFNTQHGPPARRREKKNEPALPPSPGWKESMSDDTQCEETVYKSGHAAPHRKRHLSVAHVVGNATPERGRLVRAPVNGLWRMLVGKAARGSRRLLWAPVNGVGRMVRGPAAGPKPGLLADFHKTKKQTNGRREYPGPPGDRKPQRRASETLVFVWVP